MIVVVAELAPECKLVTNEAAFTIQVKCRGRTKEGGLIKVHIPEARRMEADSEGQGDET